MPSTNTPVPSSARTTSSAWRVEPTLLRMTPATRTDVSNVTMPCTSAAMERDADDTSTTSTTGLCVARATWAVEA
jgi:hypothetical protein